MSGAVTSAVPTGAMIEFVVERVLVVTDGTPESSRVVPGGRGRESARVNRRPLHSSTPPNPGIAAPGSPHPSGVCDRPESRTIAAIIVQTPGYPMTAIRIPTELTSSELAQLADLLVATVADGASVGYLPPLPWAKAVAYWQKAIKPQNVLFLAEVDGRVAGTVQLTLESRPNGLHRAEISKLMVAPSFRRRGLGRALMEALEAEARRRDRTLLVLDTRAGDPANDLYLALGYQEAGRIPGYALSAAGIVEDTVIYYKALA